QHRAAADLHERLGHARPKPHAAPRRNDDRRGCHFAALPEEIAASRIIRFFTVSPCQRDSHTESSPSTKSQAPFTKMKRPGENPGLIHTIGLTAAASSRRSSSVLP